MVGSEIMLGLNAFKTMFDMAKALKDIDDATRRNAAVIDLQGQILAAQMQQAALIEQVGTLEAKVRSFETWDAEKERYELKNIGDGAMAYMLKPDARGTEPPHWLCPNCYGQRKQGFFQPLGEKPGRIRVFKCGGCSGTLETRTYQPEWIEA